MSTDARTIWKRRIILMLAIGLLVAVPVTLLVRSESDESNRGPKAQKPSLGKVEVDRALDVAYRLPKGWRSKREKSVLGLRSRDGTTVITVSAPASAGNAGELGSEAASELRSVYEDFEVKKRYRQKLGGLRASVATVDAVRRKGGASSLLIATAAGKKKAYLVVLSSSGKKPGESLVEAQALLNKIELKG